MTVPVVFLFLTSACAGGSATGGGEGGVSFDTGAPQGTDTMADASVTQSEIDFGSNALNIKEQKTLVFMNTADSDKVLSVSFSNADEFRVLDTTGSEQTELDDVTVSAHQSLILSVRYLRLNPGTHTSTLKIASSTDDSGEIWVSLRGTTDTVLSGEGESLVMIPASGTCSSATANQPVDIDTITDGDTETVGVKICNTGTTEVYITSLSANPSASTSSFRFFPAKSAFADETCTPSSTAISASYTDLKLAAQDLAGFVSFADADGKALTLPLHIPAKGYQKISIALKPDLSSILENGTMVRPTAFEIPLIAKTTSSSTATPLRGTLLSKGPKLQINGTSLLKNRSLTMDTFYLFQDAGAATETVPTQTLELKNSGTSPLQVALDLKNNSAVGSFGFDSCPQWPLTLAPGASQSITLHYKAMAKGPATGHLRIKTNSIYGQDEDILLASDGEERYLAGWQYKKIDVESISKSGGTLDLGQIQAVDGHTEKSLKLINGSTIPTNTLWTSFTLTLANPAVKLSYSDDTHSDISFSSGQPISITMNPGNSSPIKLKFTTPADGSVKSGETLTGTIAFSNRMKSGFTSTYSMPITLEAADRVVEAGEPIRKGKDIPMVITNFSMLLLSTSLTDKPVITTYGTYESHAWTWSDMDLDQGYVTTNALASTQTTDPDKQLTALSNTLMGNCFKAYSDPALEAEDTSHYLEANEDDKFDFKYKGTAYCIDSKNFSTEGTCASGGTLLSEEEYTQIRAALSKEGCEIAWNARDYIPEITYNYIDLPEGRGTYTLLDEDNGTTSITVPELRAHSTFAPNAETYIEGLVPHQEFNQDMLATFTTETLDDITADLIATEVKSHISEAILDATPWVDNPILKPYIRQKEGNYYFSGSPVDWSTGCGKFVALTYIGGGEETMWFFRQSPSYIFLTFYFDRGDGKKVDCSAQ